MAIFIPDLNTINKLNVQPTNGERYLLNFFGNVLDDSYEVYFNPYLNGDRPDFIILRKAHGVLVVEVKDWNLRNFSCSDHAWFYEKYEKDIDKSLGGTPVISGCRVRSPLDQIRRYYNNLMGFHIPDLLRLKLLDKKYYGLISTMVFFYGSSRADYFDNNRFDNPNKYAEDFVGLNILNKYKAPKIDNEKFNKKKRYSANRCIFTQEDLTESNFKKLLYKNFIARDVESEIFTEDIYKLFRQQLSSTEHVKEQGKDIYYTDAQQCIIYDLKRSYRKNETIFTPNPKPTINAYVRGVYGSGKTTVLAATAVQTYLQLKKTNITPKILILCYNLTLINWLQDRINAVKETFNKKDFVIINYHRFIRNSLNNLSISTENNDSSKNTQDEDLEREIYGNVSLFEKIFTRYFDFDDQNLDKYKFDAVFIDEVQDYHRSWTEIIKRFFLKSGGKYFVFGDEKQNIYDTPVKDKVVEVYFGTKSVSRFYLAECKRSNSAIQDFLKKYQKCFLSNKYDVDEFESMGEQTSIRFDFEGDEQCTLDYVELQGKDTFEKRINLINILLTYIEKRASTISPNDITVLFPKRNIIKHIDALYRYKTGSKVQTMTESYEDIFITWLNDENLFSREEILFRNTIQNFVKNRGKNRNECVANLLTCFVLLKRFPEEYKDIYSLYCKNYRVNPSEFKQCILNYINIFSGIIKRIFTQDYSEIVDHKKRYFEMNCGFMKMSTIHSFKGWESRVVFLCMERNFDSERSVAELIYTGLSRTKEHLIVVNAGNEEYGKKIHELINEQSQV